MNHRARAATIIVLGVLGAVVGATTASAGGGCHSGVTEGNGTTVEMVDACFTPTVLWGDPGQTVTWVNRSGSVHNLTANLWGHFDDITQGQRVGMRFDDEGTYPYACTYHPGMSGVIVIGDGDGPGNGSAAVVSPVDGSSEGNAGSLGATATLATTASGGSRTGWLLPGTVGLIAGVIVGLAFATGRRRVAEPLAEEHPSAR